MKLEAEQLIQLDDKKKYIISSKIAYENENYLLLTGILEDESDINSEFLVAKEVTENGVTYIEDVEDDTLILKLLEIFNTQI